MGLCAEVDYVVGYIPIEEKDADIFTKAFSRGKFKFHRGRIRVSQLAAIRF